jgi:hypothetical protein
MAFNLIILCDTRVLPDRDFREIAKRVRRLAPDVHASVATERRGLRRAQWLQLLRPTLFVEIDRPEGLRFWRGTRAGRDRGLGGKMAIYRVLEAAGLPVPAWREIVPGLELDPDEWGPWVVVKPDLGMRGIDIEAVATAELRYRGPEELPPEHLGRKGPMVAQRFIPTPEGPSYYRVTTCFGKPLFALHLHSRPSARAPEPGAPPRVTVEDAPSRLTDEADILDLARRVHAVLPQVPTIGCDFLRHRDTGELWISEINLSSVWQFSSPRGIRFQARTGLDLYAQFGALDRAAEAMIDATRRLAR